MLTRQISIYLLFIAFLFSVPCLNAKSILGIEGESHSSVGIYIKDLKTDSVLLDYNADQCLTPASITKTYTCASAMSLLDADFRFETKVFLTGSQGSAGIWNGDIIVKASGDPTLESEYFPKYGGFLGEITNALKQKGITSIKGDIILARVNEAHQYPEGPLDTWSIGDVCWVYGCGAFDFNWCDNFFGIYPATGKTTSPVPGLEYKVWDKPWREGLSMIRGVYSDSIIISGKRYTTDRKARVNTSTPNPFAVFRSMLLSKLETNGIKVSGKKSSATQRTLLLTHKSPALDEILKSLMLRSDNMFAEAMLRVLGDKYGDRETSLNAESKYWQSQGLIPKYNRILDGSGLSRTNAISPRFFGEMLEKMVESPMKSRYLRLFPVSGLSGTMKSFLADTPFKGRLAFKTGSLNSVQSYAGYMIDTKGEPTHIVVIMVNNFYCSRAELRNALKELLYKYLSSSL